MGSSTAGELTEALSWLDSGGGENLDRSSEACYLQRRLRPRMEVILVLGVERSGVNPKQCYPNGLADPLGMEQLQL